MTQEEISAPIVQKLSDVDSKRKWRWLVLGGVLVIAWFALGIYLQVQVVRSRAKLAQHRIEEARRQEFMRRGAQYQQELKEFGRGNRSRNVFDGR